MFKIQRYLKSDFIKNALTLLGGIVGIQSISIFTAPILTRIYKPADYGILGIYMSIVALIGSVSTLEYTTAIMLPEKDEEAKALLQISIFITFCVSILVLLVILCGGCYWAAMCYNSQMTNWFYLVPVSIFLSGIGGGLGVWANRKQKYKTIVFVRLITAIITPLISILYGVLWGGHSGLFMGIFCGQIVFFVLLLVGVWEKDWNLFSFYNLAVIKKQAYQYRAFPIYALPATFINTFTNQLPIVMLSKYVGTAFVGQYNLSRRIVDIPISFIGASFGEVFKQKASTDYVLTGSCRGIFLKMFTMLSLLAIPFFLILILFAPDFFAFLFGEKWREAGVLSQILCILYFFRFISSPLSYVFYIAGKQKQDFVLHIVMLILTIAAFSSANYFFKGDPLKMLLFFAISYSCVYLIYLVKSYQYCIRK